MAKKRIRPGYYKRVKKSELTWKKNAFYNRKNMNLKDF
jgi:hypothetical protein